MMRKLPVGRIWLEWTLANAIGWGLGCSSILMATAFVGGMVLPAPEIRPGASGWVVLFAMILAVAGAIAGGLVGGAQWLVLHRYTAGMGQWILLSVVGWALGAAFVMGISWSTKESVIPSVIGVAVALLAMSLGQWLILSQKSHFASWWILVHIAGLSVGGIAAHILVKWAWELDSLCLGLLIPGMVMGLVYGCVTGWVFGMILRYIEQV